MLIAVEGCSHGELDKIYETLAFIEKEHGKKVDLLLCCGDFQAVRNVYDLSCMAVPPKYLAMQNFYKYYSGEKQAPVLTIFIGGNHEASNHLQELAYGGWVAPNIFYLGNAGVVEFGGLRIAGLSGIYKGHDYLKGHFEVPPYNEDTKRSVYHVRQLEVFRLQQISRPIDLFISHDWPVGVTSHGDSAMLLRYKPFFRDDINSGQLGNPYSWDLLQKLQPKYWFAGHLHAKFSATIPHETGATKFLALDKCLPGKRFLQILEIAHDVQKQLQLLFDPEWLGVLKDTNHLWHFQPTIHYMPGNSESFVQSDDQFDAVKAAFAGNLVIDPAAFQRVAPAHESFLGEGNLNQIIREMERKEHPMPPVKAYVNPQTTWLCGKLSLTDPLQELLIRTADKVKVDVPLYSRDSDVAIQPNNSDEIPLEEESLCEGNDQTGLEVVVTTTELEPTAKKQKLDDNATNVVTISASDLPNL